MTPEPRHSPTVPSYGTASLADLSSSILASLEPEAPPEQNVLDLAPAQRACLLIVDGLGWELLRAHPADAPFLSELARNSRPITADDFSLRVSQDADGEEAVQQLLSFVRVLSDATAAAR